MSGWLTNGMVAPSSANGGLPWTSNELVAVDTGKSGGLYPESVAANLEQLSYTRGTVAALGTITTTGTATLDCSVSNDFSFTLTGTNATVTMINPSPGQRIQLYITQGAASSTIGTWTSVKWAGGTAPTLTTTINRVDLVELRWNATTGAWYGTSVLNVT